MVSKGPLNTLLLSTKYWMYVYYVFWKECFTESKDSLYLGVYFCFCLFVLCFRFHTRVKFYGGCQREGGERMGKMDEGEREV